MNTERLDSLVELSLAPLDALRTAALRGTAPLARPWLRDRHARAALLGLVGVTLAFVLTLLAPRSLLFVGPLVLGVPHLAADLRYLVVRQGLHRRPLWLLAVVPCLALSIAAPRGHWGTLAVASSALVADASAWRRIGGCACVLALGLALRGHATDVVIAHLHNLIALAIWAYWARRSSTWLPAVLGFAAVSWALASGALDDVLIDTLTRIDPTALIESLSPTLEPLWALRFVAFFAFAQAVHYAVWTRLIPEHDRARSGPRSFRSSYRALRADLGIVLPALVVLAVGLALLGLANLELGRSWYLRLATFHGPLELAVLMRAAVEGRALVREAHVG